MERPKRTHDRVLYENATGSGKYWKEEAIKLGHQLSADPNKEERIEKCLCPMCFYRKGRLGGCAFTSTQCGGCSKKMLFPSTAVDVLCPECAKERGCCKQCGADLNYKFRRKITFTGVDNEQSK